MFDYFGSMKLFTLNPFKFQGVINPAEGASFIDVDLSEKGVVNSCETSKRSVSESVVSQFDFVTGECRRSTIVPCGGDGVFWKNGTEVAYRTLKSYLANNGELAHKVAEWG